MHRFLIHIHEISPKHYRIVKTSYALYLRKSQRAQAFPDKIPSGAFARQQIQLKNMISPRKQNTILIQGDRGTDTES